MQEESINEYRRFLIPSVVAKLGNMELIARFIVAGFITGLHKSPYHGFSVEFAEHRQYMPGDDLRYLDWKIYGRTEKYFIKQFEEETNLKSYVLLDISKSMSYCSHNSKQLTGESEENKNSFNPFRKKEKKEIEKFTHNVNNISKLEYASYLAASISYLMLQQRDAISLTTYDTQIRSYVPPHATNSNLRLILKDLSNVKSIHQTGMAPCLNEIAEKIRRRGLVIIISDLFDNQAEVINAFRHFRHNKNEVIVFQILDPVEISFIEGNPVNLIDMETKEEMYSLPYAVKKAYKDTVKEFMEKYKSECSRNEIDFITLSTETPFDKALLSYLNKRKMLY
jgi:uncharacterized protein (DUF58 family)